MTIKDTTIIRRIRIDALLQNARRMISSAETTMAYRSLQMAKHALGNVLSEVGGVNPYTPVSEVSDIPPTADVASQEAFELESDHLENINIIREVIELEKVAFKMDYHLVLSQDKNTLLNNLLFEHYKNLCQAKNWYGEELASMREKARETEVKEAVSESAKEKKKTSTKKIVDKDR